MAWVKNQKLWVNWNGKIYPCAKFPGKKKWKSLDAFPRGEVHNREEGEMAPKSREEGEIGWKSREEGVLPSCTSPIFPLLAFSVKIKWLEISCFLHQTLSRTIFCFQTHSWRTIWTDYLFRCFLQSQCFRPEPDMFLGCDRVKKNSMGREKRGGVSSP